MVQKILQHVVFVDFVAVSGEGYEGGASMMGVVMTQRQDSQQQGGGQQMTATRADSRASLTQTGNHPLVKVPGKGPNNKANWGA